MEPETAPTGECLCPACRRTAGTGVGRPCLGSELEVAVRPLAGTGYALCLGMARPPHPKTLLRLAEETDRHRLIELALSLADSPQVYNHPEIEVTPVMIEAGYRVLAESGIIDDPLEADKLTVAEIYRAMRSLVRE